MYGRSGFNSAVPEPKRFPARQTLEASMAVARLHQLNDENVVFAQQNPDVIDHGVFHNDVISVGNQNLYFYHQLALLDTKKTLAEIQQKFEGEFHFVEVPSNEVSVKDAVESYLFNSQLVTLPDGDMAIVVPEECRKNESVWRYLEKLPSLGSPVQKVLVYDVTESMKNGGGPACLRLRVALSESELQAVNPKTLMNQKLFETLNAWVDKHYRDRIEPADLLDPSLLTETHSALDELTQILGLGPVYDFQR